MQTKLKKENEPSDQKAKEKQTKRKVSVPLIDK